jgi:hypothetical protein
MKVLRSFEVLFVSRMDILQARTEAIQEEVGAKMDAHYERMGASECVPKRDDGLPRSDGGLSAE